MMLKPGDLCMFDPALAQPVLVRRPRHRGCSTPADVYDVSVCVRLDLPFVFLRAVDDKGPWLASYVVLYTHAGLVIEDRRFIVPLDDAGLKKIRKACAAGICCTA